MIRTGYQGFHLNVLQLTENARQIRVLEVLFGQHPHGAVRVRQVWGKLGRYQVSVLFLQGLEHPINCPLFYIIYYL